MSGAFTTQLQAGLGMIEETKLLLELWQRGMDGKALNDAVLEAGLLPHVSARRLRNVIMEGFAPRYLREGGTPALTLKAVAGVFSRREFDQLAFIYTCRANPILSEFVHEVYWPTYSAGRESLTTADAREWVARASDEGRTVRPWSDGTILRVASYLTGICADFGFLESGVRSARRILTVRLESRVAAILAYDLHFSGLADNRILSDPEWALFGLDAPDVLDELKRLALGGLFVVQHAGGSVRIGWHYKTREEVIHAITR